MWKMLIIKLKTLQNTFCIIQLKIKKKQKQKNKKKNNELNYENILPTFTMFVPHFFSCHEKTFNVHSDEKYEKNTSRQVYKIS